MKKHILLFHIGMHKTGTTSLQKFIYNNQNVLQKYGWVYPDLCPSEYSAYDTGNGSKLLRREKDERRWEIIKNALENDNVIISSEGFWAFPSNLLEAISIAQSFCSHIKVMVYLRRQDRAVESMYNQQVKSTSEHGSIGDYMNHRLVWSCNYLDTLDKISAKIGQENVIVRVYEKGQFEGCRNDIFSDFLYSLPGENVPFKQHELKIPEKQNLSLDGNYFEIKKLCNSICDGHDHIWWGKKQRREFARINSTKESHTTDGLSTGYFTKQERIELLYSQKQNNIEIAKKYLNRTDGKLFYDEFVDYPVYQKQVNDCEEDIIRTFSAMLYLQQRKIEIAPVVAAVALLRKERKLAFWGLGDNGQQFLDYALVPDIIIDNDPSKNHRNLEELIKIPVIPSNEIDNWKDYFIVVTPLYSQEIEDTLRQNGLKKMQDYIIQNDFFDYWATY